jgi:predicted nucleic acid-binding protein
LTFVLDACVALAWCFADEASPDSARLFRATLNVGASVPPLWIYEVSNGLRTARRAGRLSQQAFREWRAQLLQLPVRAAPTTHGAILGDALTLAMEHHLTVYDASYLELATRLRVPLATLDGGGRRSGLRQAATAAGVPLVSAELAAAWANLASE